MKALKNLVCLLIITDSILNAQELTTKNGEVILPQAKDWSIGLDATRLLNKSTFSFAGALNSITGKYFIDDKNAHRASLRIGVNGFTVKNPTLDRVASTSSVIAYPSPLPTKENTWKRTSTLIGLSYGRERRRGNTRLQGVYGAEASVYFSYSTDKFVYGNKLTPVTTGASVKVDPEKDAIISSEYGNANNIVISPSIQGVIGSARVLETKSGVGISLGARAFIGAEYFVLPKLSIGGEFGWGFGYSFAGRSKVTLESVGQASIPNVTSKVEVQKTVIDGGKTNRWWFDNDNSNLIGGSSASLRINLYF